MAARLHANAQFERRNSMRLYANVATGTVYGCGLSTSSGFASSMSITGMPSTIG